jgi:hypothetical protein
MSVSLSSSLLLSLLSGCPLLVLLLEVTFDEFAGFLPIDVTRCSGVGVEVVADDDAEADADAALDVMGAIYSVR